MFALSAMRGRFGARAAFAVVYAFLASLPLLASPPTQAQENAISPPPPLQWPTLTGPDSDRGFLIVLLRAEFERGANAELCKVLMRDQNLSIPPNFDFSMCPPDLAQKVRNREGKVRWAEGAKPIECGMSCWGRPFMTSERFLNQPNERFAMFFGHLDFEVDNPGPNRRVRFGYEAQFRCAIPPGARDGGLEIRAVFGQPVVGDPSLWESVADFLIPLNISRQIEAGIRRQLSKPGTTIVPDQGRCRSIGVDASPQGNPALDTIRSDSPPRRPVGATAAATRATALGKTATVRFLRIKRNPPTFRVEPPTESGTFEVYLNGIPASFPDVPALPPSGGATPINLCKTIDMNGADRLQIIFVNSHGGAVWSQFTPGQNFGAGPTRVMTTGRKVVVPGLPRPPPGTGTTKPQTLIVREFELTFAIEYHEPPSKVLDTQAAGGGGRPSRPGAIVTRPPTTGTVATDGRATPQPCRKI